MKAIYHLPTNTLEQLLEMEAPDMDKYNNDYFLAYGHIKAYENHIASLQRISCDPSCAVLWTNQQVVEEGKDFEERSICAFYKTGCIDKENCDDCRIVAVPLSAPVEQDELWREAIHFLVNNPGLTYEAQVKGLCARFAITKKITP